MKKIFFILTAGILALASCQKSIEEKAADDVREYTRRECPRMIAENIRQDSMTFESDTRTLVYHYTLQGVLDDKEKQQQYTEQYKSQLRQEIKSTPSLKNYVEAGFKFRYVYRSERSGEIILNLDI